MGELSLFKPDTATATPNEHEQRANEQAAAIAAREAYAHWLRSGDAAVLAAYDAWRAGERDWPWPTPAQPVAADDAVRSLAFDPKLIDLARGHRQFNKQMGGCDGR